MARLRIDLSDAKLTPGGALESPKPAPNLGRPIEPTLLRGLMRRPGFLALVAFSIGWVYFTTNYWIFTVSAAMLIAIQALGLMILVGWAKEMTLAQAAMVGTGVYITGYLYRPDNGGAGWPYILAAGSAIALVAAIYAVTSLACVRLSGVYVMVLTLGLQFLIERIVFSKGILTGGITPLVTPRPSLFGIGLEGDRTFYFFLLGVTGIVLLLMARLRRSRYGRSLILVGSNQRAAAALGVSPWRYKMFAFTACGVLAGLAGALSASLYASPPSTFQYISFTSLAFLAIPVLAGFESLLAVVAVAISFSVAPQALESWKINALILGGGGLIGGTLMGPRGLGGNILDRWRKIRRSEWRARGSYERIVVLSEEEPNAAPTLDDRYAVGDIPLDARRQEALELFETWLPARRHEPVALEAIDVSINFGGVQALRNVSLTVPNGALVGLIGPNGAGKSTMFDIVNGLKRPTSGQIHLFGRDVTRLKAWDRARLGMSRTFQANRINLDIPVKDNLLTGAHTMVGGSLAGVLAGIPASWKDMERAEEAAWAVAVLLDIDRHWDEVSGALSFGNRRRVEIGRSLLAGPRLLLLDEPAAGLDPRAAGILFSVVKRLHQDLGLTVLLVEHYVRAVLKNCDLVYVLSQGALVAQGSPAEVANHPDVRSQYLGLDFDVRSFAAQP